MTRARLAAVVWALAVLLGAASAVLGVLAGQYLTAAGAVVYLAFPTVGLIITRRQPWNVVGWTFLVAGTFNAVNTGSLQFTRAGVSRNWPDRTIHFAAWLQVWVWVIGLGGLLIFGLLFFPDGRLPSRRWRPVVSVGLVGMAMWLIPIPIAAWGVGTTELLKPDTPQMSGWRAVAVHIGQAGIVLMLLATCGALAALVNRWRRSSGTERLQVKWVAAAAIFAVVLEVTADLVNVSAIVGLVESFGFVTIAVAACFAITRYHLYDIDRIVSRTVTYTAVTGLLIAVYVGIVAAASALVPSRYGSVGVSTATLVVAGLFVPVRRHVQRAVDRRFNRARYDAQRTIDAFAARLRNQYELEALSNDLLATVSRTVAPARAALWLVRPPGSAR